MRLHEQQMKIELLHKVLLPRNQEESHFTCEFEKCLETVRIVLRCPYDFQPKPIKSHSVFLIFIVIVMFGDIVTYWS